MPSIMVSPTITIRTAMLDNPVTGNPINVHAGKGYRFACRLGSKP
jgi:hypothetical protein